MLMPGRKYSIANTNYRYGFNGKENDNDIENSAQDYGMRIYDGRLGRFLTVDPITAKYPFLTPYQFGSNRPIDGIDLDGLEWAIYSFKAFKKNGQAYVNVHRDAYSNTWIDRIGGAQYWLRPAGSPSGYQGIAFDSFDAMFNAAKRFADGQADYKSAKIAFDEKNLEIFEAIVATNLVINAHDAIDGYVNQKIRAKTNLGILPALETEGLEGANFAQSKINKKEFFSPAGQQKYSELAGTRIQTVNNLVEALKAGKISPSQIPLDYVEVNGGKVILNTRTSTALNRAGIPMSEGVGINKTGVKVPGMTGATFDDLAKKQTQNSGLPNTGTSKVPE